MMTVPESIAHYKIAGKLGAGGMGAVYRAIDTKLNREVAIKMLPPAFADDPQYLARFEREAQMLASLQHANIATIYGVEEGALVMELVEGPTLAERIGQGPVPLDEALDIARQIVDGLEAAHERGVIHRDLKPANIKLTREGAVKILDFGLAKAAQETATANASASISPTLSLAMTQAGYILGTAGYMAPEQARGRPVDKRADIWAFGVVLFEMLTGKVTFEGETVSDTLAAVLRAELDFGLLPAETPAAVRRLLRRCLERDRKKRLADIADARLELEASGETAPAAAPVVMAAPRTPWLAWGALAALPVAVALGWWLRPIPPAPALQAEFQVGPPEGAEFGGQGSSVSPDGRRLIVRAAERSGSAPFALYLRDLAGQTYRKLPGTDGGSWEPAWSPDSKSIAFLARDKWWRLDLAGGQPMALCDSFGSWRGAAWSESGTILLAAGASPLFRIPASGGKPVPATRLEKDQTVHSFPSFLPGGRYFIYTATAARNSLWVGDLEGREPARKLMEMSRGEALYADSGQGGPGVLLYGEGDSLMGVRFDPRNRTIVSEPFPVLNRMTTTRLADLPVSVSRPARVLLANLNASAVNSREELALLDRAGKKTATLSSDANYGWGHLEFSPDGKTLSANGRAPNGANELWSVDLRRGAISRVTFDGGSDKAQSWAADARRIFYSLRGTDANSGIYVTAADGSGKPTKLLSGGVHHLSASPDGRYVAYESRTSASEIRLLDVSKPDRSEPLIGGPATYSWPQFSPDGRWMSYSSTETGRGEIYVQSFPPGRGKWQISRDGGRIARWRGDGKEIVILEGSGDSRVYSVAVKYPGGTIDFDPPQLLFQTVTVERGGSNYFALSRDGQRIAVNLPGPVAPGRPLTVMLDWMAGLKQ